MDAKPLRIRFDKVEELIKICNGIRYLELFNLCDAINARINSRYNAIFDKMNHLTSKKSGITDSINHNFSKIRIDLCNSLPIEKKLIFYNCYNTH